MSKYLFRTTSNPFKKQPFQAGPLFNTTNGRQSNVNQKWFYNQPARGYKSGMGLKFYKKGTKPHQFRKFPNSPKSRKQVHKKSQHMFIL